MDPQGRWFAIEIKRGDVNRRTMAQVLDYAGCLDALDGEELRAVLEPYLDQRSLDLDEILNTRDAVDSLNASERDIVIVVARLFNVFEMSRPTKCWAARVIV